MLWPCNLPATPERRDLARQKAAAYLDQTNDFITKFSYFTPGVNEGDGP
jgi:hypothetical protein